MRLARARRPAARTRRGVTVVMVLGLVTISLALAYTITRSQISVVQLQSNSNLDLLARQAAMTGFSAGLRNMFDATWGGVNSALNGSLPPSQTYTVTWQTGDASLAATDVNWPYRVTMLSVGVATDPAHQFASATHRVQAVVQLLPRQLTNEPTNFATMLGYTVYQIAQATCELELPCHVGGAMWLQGTLNLCDDYPPSSYGANQYLSDLNTMQFFGYGDNRPLTGPLSLPFNQSSSTNLSQASLLGAQTFNTNPSTVTGWNYPGEMKTYQLYAGGQVYSVPIVASTLTNITLAADPHSNPLGLFYNSGNVTLGNGVSITGTLVVGGDVTISGTRVSLQPLSLPALQGSSQSIQLPTVVAQGNFKVNSLAQATVQGLVACWNTFEILPGSQSTSFSLKGRVITKGFLIQDRSEWSMSGSQWSSTWTQFNNQWWGWVWFYPLWLYQQKSLNYAPLLTVVPETTSVTYHWKDASSPVYVPGSGDPGLRWTMVGWTDDF